MPVEILLAALAFMTLIGVLVFAYVSKKRTEKEMHNPDHKKSALAKDGPTGRTEERL